ncbi:MAG: helix-turn-helix domain-containing protein [Akkermansia sp.]|nr:helix-turn-helix domain-containing protein [Akkermansia sp.]
MLAKQVGIAPSTIYRVLEKLEEHGIIQQSTQGERNRLYTYSAYQSMIAE